ncbi:MAG TPA: grasp-with-spasm system ATP-grasp peptide maturase [Tenuifilaceae bacterium]|nr:grasp-with-spasm system ATP-grasp peptide maturase [Tenuifilaceae bacterium]HPI44156.1 grasp-with-spasm system ATP-grasp peptide maturase [Tenuifilaceae bacterium]HPN22219.1 grasp-with-spasm system ATP-grasp peptide maturase [Tenuifilaceae bacterium]
MINIISEYADSSTNKVIDWLLYYNHAFNRINADVSLKCQDIIIDNSKIKKKKDILWFRRGRIQLKNPYVVFEDEELDKDLKEQLTNEKRILTEYVYRKIKSNSKSIGDFYKTIDLNKLNVLEKAKETGLKIPPTLITTSKESLVTFFREHKNIITKAISDVKAFNYNRKGFIYTYTSMVEDIESLPDEFFPSLFQKNISKKYELRVFYLNKKFYSMAIFSQNDSQTKTDFRNYNFEKPNRNVPYSLPRVVKVKINKLMKVLELETGSLDLLVDENDDYYFLEINPVGQYGMVSYPCNYYLDKIIAEELIRNK